MRILLIIQLSKSPENTASSAQNRVLTEEIDSPVSSNLTAIGEKRSLFLNASMYQKKKIQND
jgi:hypothetical protein